MKVLITSCGCQPAIEAVRAWKQSRETIPEFKDLVIYGMDMTPHCYGSKNVDTFIQAQHGYSREYIEEIIEISSNKKIDAVVLSDTHEMNCAFHRIIQNDKITDFLIMPCIPLSLEPYVDKESGKNYIFNSALIKYPCTSFISSYTGPFPAVVKARTGAGTRGFRIVDSIGIRELDSFEYIAQQYIQGQEYTCDFFNYNKEIIVTPRRRLQVKDGQVFCGKLENNTSVIEAVKEVVKANDLWWGNIQVIQDRGGTVWFIEFNGKFGSGIPLSIAAGFNQPEFVLRKHFNFSIPTVEIKWNLQMARALTNIFF